MTVKIYRSISLAMTVIFIIVGGIFLFLPELVIEFFNNLSIYFGLEKLRATVDNLYIVLSVSYMYLVSIIAYSMYKKPEEKIYPILLAHAKLASSILSLYFVFTRGYYLIYIVNFIVDGLIGLLALYLYCIKEFVK